MLAALAVLARVPPVVLLLVLLAWVHPLVGPVAVVVLVGVRRARPTRTAPALRLVALASEVGAGGGIRDALAGAVDDPGLVRRLRLGRPWTELAADLRAAFGDHGAAVLAAVGVVRRTGGSAGPLFGELAEEALAEAELAGERRAAAAPVIAQGLVVGGVPLAVLAHGAVTGRLAEVAARGTLDAALVGFGALATVAGAAVVAGVLWRESRS